MAQAFQFGSPSDYSDWANYAGFDRKTGEQEAFKPSEGVAPPSSVSEYLTQAIAPATKKMSTISNAMDNIGQGSMVGAYQAFKSPQTSLHTPVVNANPYNYTTDDLE
jgi:hypothetical protein